MTVKVIKRGSQADAMAQQVQQHKKDLLLALEKSLGIVTRACKTVSLDRTTFYRYVKDDAEFAADVKAIDNAALDFAESALHKQIQAGVPASTIFYLKTKGKERGYVERQEVEHGGSVNVTGELALRIEQIYGRTDGNG